MSHDGFGALCLQTHVALHGAKCGRLAGLTFVAKDVFDIAGYRTGAGNPDWLRTHGPAENTAPVIGRLLRAGASMVGRSNTDELAYSLNGQNWHYGTPVNPAAPDRIPGGSSSGSAVAVAGRLVDFSIGTDCGGSVRLPASYCGVLGFRPTHGRIPLNHVIPLAPSFDVVGWFARDAEVLEAVGEILLEESPTASVPGRLYVATDVFALVSDAVRKALEAGVQTVSEVIGRTYYKDIMVGVEIDRLELFRIIQGAEAWAAHGAWIRTTQPTFGPDVRERFKLAAGVTMEQLVRAREQREAFATNLYRILKGGAAVCLPTAPGPAPAKTASLTKLEEFREQALQLLTIAGLARMPQISLPLGSIDGSPIGLSLISQRGTDMQLLALAKRLLSKA